MQFFLLRLRVGLEKTQKMAEFNAGGLHNITIAMACLFICFLPIELNPMPIISLI